ncbi:D-glycero-beta-D-manno-heptose-1,7-bisphosphate 7-phosphatase [hydrothermal vent metagenome]|uniref:D,D-heptose 1,7-bisphosphate phosphatase n=1 Tax=hydrothermal vent metagenome TaxID=652676 RepID=A0A3B0VDC1_9ZZZZ
MSDKSRPAVFLDRDGTINEQMGYINHISRFHLLPSVAEAVRLLNERQVPVVVVTNQSGLARGYFPPELLDEVHEKMAGQLAQKGAHIDGLYICPHHPEAKEERYRQECCCRKPKTGLLEQAAVEMNLDLKRSFMVGDRWSDLKCAIRAGATPILVLTGYGRGDLQYIGPQQEIRPAYVADDLLGAARWIIRRMDATR